jgi:hypothetical protein
MKYTGDQNQVCGLYESGTYASTSGTAFWFGMVQNHTVDEDMGVIPIRYAGQGDRNVGKFVDGPTTYTGTLEYFPQNWRMLKFALGSVHDNGSPSPFTHTYAEVDNVSGGVPEIAGQLFPSFTIEDSHTSITGSNFVRTIGGCFVDNFNMTVSEGNPISCSLGYNAQDCDFSSGAKTSVTAVTSVPFMWSHSRVQITSGTNLTNVKEFTLGINNNINMGNYVDNSRDIADGTPLNRDYEISMTLNADDETTKAYYDQYFLGGSEFNLIFSAVAVTDSGTVSMTFSGCKLIDMNAPTPNEGLNEQTLTIHPTTMSAEETSTDQYYNAGSYQ